MNDRKKIKILLTLTVLLLGGGTIGGTAALVMNAHTTRPAYAKNSVGNPYTAIVDAYDDVGTPGNVPLKITTTDKDQDFVQAEFVVRIKNQKNVEFVRDQIQVIKHILIVSISENSTRTIQSSGWQFLWPDKM